MLLTLLDGALATELERRGFSTAGPLWSAKVLLEHPQAIEDLHLDYLRAGADVITTATYQASREGFQRAGLSHSASRRSMLDAIVRARRARERFRHDGESRPVRPIQIAGSIGPYGAVLHDGSEYHGTYDLSEMALKKFHLDRLTWFSEDPPDLWLLETIPSLREAEIILAAIDQLRLPQPVWLSVSVREDGTHLSSGEALADLPRRVFASGLRSPAAVGVNCLPPDLVRTALQSIGPQACPLLAYPNSGETWNLRDAFWQGSADSSDAWLALLPQWLEAGATILGGCCRTGPSTIAAIHRRRLTSL